MIYREHRLCRTPLFLWRFVLVLRYSMLRVASLNRRVVSSTPTRPTQKPPRDRGLFLSGQPEVDVWCSRRAQQGPSRSGCRAGGERVAHRFDDQCDVDRCAARDAVRTGRRNRTAEVDVHQDDDLVDRHVAAAIAVAGARLSKWIARARALHTAIVRRADVPVVAALPFIERHDQARTRGGIAGAQLPTRNDGCRALVGRTAPIGTARGDRARPGSALAAVVRAGAARTRVRTARSRKARRSVVDVEVADAALALRLAGPRGVSARCSVRHVRPYACPRRTMVARGAVVGVAA